MVVWPQCRCILSHYAVSRYDVLFSSKSCEPSCVLLPFVHYSLLVPDLHLHLGRTSPLALHFPAGLGTIAGCRIFHYAYCTLVGWYAQWSHDLERSMGSRP